MTVKTSVDFQEIESPGRFYKAVYRHIIGDFTNFANDLFYERPGTKFGFWYPDASDPKREYRLRDYPFVEVLEDMPWQTSRAYTVKSITLLESHDSSAHVVEPSGYIQWEKILPRVYMRKPRRPVIRSFCFPPLREPSLVLLTDADLKPIQEPKGRSPKSLAKWRTTKLPAIRAQRRKLLERTNLKRERNFRKRKEMYEASKRTRAAKLRRWEASRDACLANYESRLRRWEALCERAKHAYYRKQARPDVYTEWHPYRKLELHAIGNQKAVRSTWEAPANGFTPDGKILMVEPYGTLWKGGWQVMCKYSSTAPFNTPVSPSDYPSIAESTYNACLSVLKADVITDIEEILRKRVYNDIRTGNLHIGNMIAERAQTLELLVKSWRSLVTLICDKEKFLYQIFRDRLKSPMSALKQGAQDNLAFFYGVQPLVGDIQTALGILRNGMEFSSSCKRRMRRSVHIEHNGATFDGRVTVQYVLRWRIVSEITKTLAELGIINPLEIAWEMTPWSFVVDWVIPIGEYINNLTATQGLMLDLGSVSYRLVGSWDLTDESFVRSPTQLTSLQTRYYPGTYAGTLKERRILTDFPTPPALHCKNPLSLIHGLEAISLMLTNFRHPTYHL